MEWNEMPATSPTIWIAQNTANHRRMVAAFARLYSDAKKVFAVRITVVFVLAVCGSIAAIAFPDLRSMIGGVGGVVLFALSFIVGGVEKWLRLRAASVQEKFDTDILQLPWPKLHAERPSQHLIARAATRYRGTRAQDWYGDTKGLERPLDVLVTQSSNLGWGATMHRIWAGLLFLGLIVIILLLAIASVIAGFTLTDTLLALVVPALAPLKEIAEQIKQNWDAFRSKDSLEQKLDELWSKSLLKDFPSDADLRSIQDKILLLRQSNPYVPDWLDNRFRDRNEAALRAGVEDRVSEGERAGLSE